MLVPVSLLAESMLHTLDPFVFEITTGVGPRWYGASYLSGFLVGWVILRWLANSGRIPLNSRQVGDLLTNAVIGVIVGGRLGHCVFYERELLVQFTSGFPYWGLLAIHKGGMASHGGVIGVAVAVALSARREKIPFLAVGDAVVFVVPWGLMFGRLANWINGELWGRALPLEMQANPPWWSVKYPHELEQLVQIPPQLESLRAIAPATERVPDATFIQWMVATAYDHANAAHEQVVQTITPLLSAYYPSQFFQALAEGPALILLMSLAWLRPRRAGTMGAIFFVSYGLLRFATEQFREPDQGIDMVGTLTLPMALSIAMIAVGAGIFALSRSGILLGGLLRRRG